MEDINRRNNLILLYLLESDGWLTSMQLARKLQVSDRTIRSSIAELSGFLKSKGITLIAERGKGYQLADGDRPKVREILTTGGFSTEQETQNDLLLELIRLSAPVDVDELSDRLFMSRTTLENELKQVRKELEESSSDLILCRKKNKIWLEGSERSKRVLIGYHIDNRFHNPMSYDLIGYASYFPYDQLTLVTDVVNTVLRGHKITASDTGIVAIAVHILIAIKRIELGFTLQEPYLSKSEKADCTEEYGAAQEMFAALRQYFPMAVKETEYEYEALAYCIFFRRFFRTGQEGGKNIEKDVKAECLEAIRNILQEIRDVYLLDLTRDHDLYVSLAYHLQSTMDKSGYCQNYVNPILADVRSRYPFVFDLAIHFRDRFFERLGVSFNESETAYLAVHLGASMERLKIQNDAQKLKAVLICHANPATSQFLMAKILSLFGSRLYLCGPYSVFDAREVKKEKPDLIISTANFPVGWEENIPLAYINLIPDTKDIRQLGRIIDEAAHNTTFRYAFTDFFSESFFYPMLEAEDSTQVIERMANDLIQADIVQEEFKESTFQRETFSTTVLQNGIAMPHPSGFYSKKTTIAVATLAHPIQWGSATAQVVFMLAVKSGDQQFLRNFYELIVNLSESAEHVNRMLRVQTFDELLECFNTFY